MHSRRLFAGIQKKRALYQGAYVGGGLDTLTTVAAYEANSGKNLSIIMFYVGWGVTGGGQNFPTSSMNTIRSHGSIPMITWEPWNWVNGVDQPAYSLTSIINGNHDAYITQFALAAKAWGHPFLLRWAHEMNGNWYPWSELANGNSPGQFIQAWNHVRDIFRTNNVTNVSWTWSPNVVYSGSISLAGLYPGDENVDWTAMDGYNWGTTFGRTWQSFSQVFGPTYQAIMTLTTKPMLVAETASTEEGGVKSQWITNALTTEIHNYPNIRGFIWFNENKETDWRIESTETSRVSFAQAIASPRYAANDFAGITSIL